MEIRYQGRFAMTALASRGRFEGVAKIIRFNTRFYLGSALGVVGGVLVLTLRGLPMWLKAAVMVGTAPNSVLDSQFSVCFLVRLRSCPGNAVGVDAIECAACAFKMGEHSRWPR
jgi:hypothetical protein